ncbi:MAG: PorP/SprF family type IX secretion system membrane protein [Bacteroidales bacterium]|nr:PorP/SprF family type IX secretion system membrane protein [Bacteroidales bacterium]
MKKYIFIYLLLSCVVGTVLGQDASFSQFYASPMYANPAMAGLAKCGQLQLHYRNQWPAVAKAYEVYHVSYDQYVESMKSGVGIMFTSDRQANGMIIQNQISAAYDYQFQFSRSVYASFGLQFTYGQNAINTENLTVNSNGTIIDFNTLLGDPTFQSLYLNDAKLSRSYTDFSTGFVLGFKEHYYLGAAVHHLNRPDISFYQSVDNFMPMKYTLQFGAIFLKQSSHYSKETVYLSPNLFVQQQGQFRQISLGLYGGINSFVLGSWYRHNFSNPDALIILLGLRKDNLKFGYSYDITISGLSTGLAGSHEISVSWNICTPRSKKRRIRTIKCPTF